MSTPIVKRVEGVLYTPKGEEKPPVEGSQNVATCTRQRRLRAMQSDLNVKSTRSLGSLLDSAGSSVGSKEKSQIPPTCDRSQIPTCDTRATSLKDLIDARIAQTEGPPAPTPPPPRKDDFNRTLVDLDSLAASIYCWSPNACLHKERAKPRFIQDKLRGPIRTAPPDADNSHNHRNKDTFINFSLPALIVVAENPETPANTLKWLAAHHSAAVRKTVAKNESTDEETLRLLAEDFDPSVQSAVLDNPCISKELIVKLAGSANFSTASKARKVYYVVIQSNLPPPTAHKRDNSTGKTIQNEREFLRAIADSADTSRRLLVKSPQLAADWHIRMLVAGDPNATAEILWQLASHPISQVKRKLVDKYNCLLETVVNLKGYNHPGDTEALAASATETML